MDSLTARLLSRTGLNPVKPTFPPIHNMRVVHLKKDLTDAEKFLHEARKALDQLQQAQKIHASNPNHQNIKSAKLFLYDAMQKLQRSEADYFATKYIGRDNKTVLEGWENEGKQVELTMYLSQLKNKCNQFLSTIAPNGVLSTAFHHFALNAVQRLKDMINDIQSMDSDWYDSNNLRIPVDRKPITINGYLINVKNDHEIIHQSMRNALALPETTSTEIATKRSTVAIIKQIMHQADVCERIATMIDKNIWQLPYDLRVI